MTDVCSTCRTPWRDAVALSRRVEQLEATTTLATHLATMLDVAPCDWWRFVGCGYCMARRGEGCVQGYDGWPNPAREPHAGRQRKARQLHATIWLLANHPGDVLGESADSEGAGGAVSGEQATVGQGAENDVLTTGVTEWAIRCLTSDGDTYTGTAFTSRTKAEDSGARLTQINGAEWWLVSRTRVVTVETSPWTRDPSGEVSP